MKRGNLVHFMEVIKTGDLYFYYCYHFGLVKIKASTAGRFYRRDGENVIFFIFLHIRKCFKVISDQIKTYKLPKGSALRRYQMFFIFSAEQLNWSTPGDVWPEGQIGAFGQSSSDPNVSN